MELAAWGWCIVVSATLVSLYFLWKHHPSYGANPGAPAFPLVGSIPFLLLNKHRFYQFTCDLFDRSPSLTRRVLFGRSIVLSTADPRVVQHILKSHFSIYPKGPSFYPFFTDLLGNGIFNCDGALWTFQRKIASHVFTSNSLRDFVVGIADSEIGQRLLPALERHVSNAPFDLQALFMHYTFDTICQLTFGADPACLDSSKLKESTVMGASALSTHVNAIHEMQEVVAQDVADHTSYMKVPDHLIHGFVQGFQVALQITAERFLQPDLLWQTKKALKIGSEKRLMDALEAVNKFTRFVIEQSKRELASGKDRNDLLARFMRVSEAPVELPIEGAGNREEQEGFAISDSLLRDILLSFILAGRETVASGVSFAIWLICMHPSVEKKVLEEIRGILKDRELNLAGSGRGVATFTYDEVRRMNYLQAVLSESMRLYPPVPSDCKYAAQDDVLPDGTQVLQGYQISYNVFAMGRAARVWGKDCLEFRPERWLDENGLFMPVSPFKYPVFQAGPRVCLGKDFAFIQMKLLVASLLRDFEFMIQPGFEPKLSYGVSMLMVNGLPVTVKRRSMSVG